MGVDRIARKCLHKSLPKKAYTESPETSVQGLAARGDQSRGIKKPEMVTLVGGGGFWRCLWIQSPPPLIRDNPENAGRETTKMPYILGHGGDWWHEAMSMHAGFQDATKHFLSSRGGIIKMVLGHIKSSLLRSLMRPIFSKFPWFGKKTSVAHPHIQIIYKWQVSYSVACFDNTPK